MVEILAEWDPVSVIAGGVFGGLLFIGLIACIGGFLHGRRERLLIHAERMKALELGRELPDDPATARLKAIQTTESGDASIQPVSPSEPKSLASKCYSTTSYACGTGFVFAFLAASNQAVAIAIAAATGAIGVAGMICGTILAAKMPEPTASELARPTKVIYDPEAV